MRLTVLIPRLGRLLAAAVLVLPSLGLAGGALPDKLALLDLLRRGEFAVLDSQLNGLQEDFEAGRGDDLAVAYAFEAFETSDLELESRLADWIEARPSSYAARLARAAFYNYIAHLSRGGELYRDTPKQRLEEMKRYHVVAGADAAKAIALNPRLSTAYALLIRLSLVQSEFVLRDRFLEDGLRAAPASLAIRDAYLRSLHPNWGGSAGQVEAFLKRTREQLPDGVDLGALEGYADYMTGLVLWGRDRGQDAIAYFDRALSYGDNSAYYFSRSSNFYDLGMQDRGLEDLNRYLELWPQKPGALAERARRLAEAGRYDEALADWELALKLDPLKPRALRIRAYYLARFGRYEEALADFERALVFGAHHAEIYYDRGMMHLLQLRNPEAARADLVRATELDPDKPKYWYGYAKAFSDGPNSKRRECPSVLAYQRFQTLCGRTGGCFRDWLDAANHFVESQEARFGPCL